MHEIGLMTTASLASFGQLAFMAFPNRLNHVAFLDSQLS